MNDERLSNSEMFNSISPRYALLNGLLSLGLDRLWRRRAARELAPSAGGRYLDLGPGTAEMCVAVLRREPKCTLVGLDAAGKMLPLGRERLAREGMSGRAEFVRGGAADLSFPEDTFDGAVSAFCIRNVTDRPRALRELARVTRPGGRVVILELHAPRGRLMRGAFGLYSLLVIRPLARLLSSPWPYRQLTESMADFPPPERVTEMMSDAGLADVRHVSLTGGLVALFTGIVSSLDNPGDPHR
ncbi:MAG: ubiquinone/menaquinone biosynthesis methyltransferase [Planctomycetota bacterium]|jgi:demethylmenaquinone methyltransferase/2-methoxy-6-polyprenyl-1,4-benzoquinol methylase